MTSGRIECKVHSLNDLGCHGHAILPYFPQLFGKYIGSADGDPLQVFGLNSLEGHDDPFDAETYSVELDIFEF